MDKCELISLIEESQSEYIKTKSKKELKDNSQFFTPSLIIEKMLSTINLDGFAPNDMLYALEPAAGLGIMIVCSMIYIIENTNNINNIHFDIYEKDAELIDILQRNLTLLSNYCSDKINFTYTLFNNNFIEYNKHIWSDDNFRGTYSLIISNPPYKKLNVDSSESIIMNNIINGQPNIYSLFICMCSKLLINKGQFVVLSPRNYLIGEYSKKIRMFLFKNTFLTNIHSFDKRNLFAPVNQEVIISTFKKDFSFKSVQISHNGNFSFNVEFNSIVINKNDYTIFIPRNRNDLSLFKAFSNFNNKLEDLGLKISVGSVVQFRCEDDISENTYRGNYKPLLIAKDIQPNNTIDYFVRKKGVRKTHNKSISNNFKHLLPNKNYLIIRKVAAKDDTELITVSVLRKDFFDTDKIGLDNNLLYIHRINKSESLTLLECYGIYCYLNSKEFSEFYSLINGTHTINVTDFKEIKFPDLDIIKALGRVLLKSDDFSKENCSKILKIYLL